MKNQNEIKYFVNPEKKVCVAKLDGVRADIEAMLGRFAIQHGFSLNTFRWENDRDMDYKLTKNIPNSITGRATCSDMDEFNVETGCAIARARLLEKLYKYRTNATYDCSVMLSNMASTLYDKAKYFATRVEDYAEEAKSAYLN